MSNIIPLPVGERYIFLNYTYRRTPD